MVRASRVTDLGYKLRRGVNADAFRGFAALELIERGLLDLAVKFLVPLEFFLGGVAALGDLRAFEVEPRALLIDRRSVQSPRSSSEPSREMPSLYMMSNSASRNGGATLFFTIFTRVRLPSTVPSGVLIAAMRRMSMRTEE